MARLYILIKKKNSKKPIGAIPSRPGISRAVLQQRARQQIKKGFVFRIITEMQLKRLFSRLLIKKKKPSVKQRVRKR